jgi:hypothetical protein
MMAAPLDYIVCFEDLPLHITVEDLFASGVDIKNLDSDAPILQACGITFVGKHALTIGTTLVVGAAVSPTGEPEVVSLTSRRIVFRPIHAKGDK